MNAPHRALLLATLFSASSSTTVTALRAPTLEPIDFGTVLETHGETRFPVWDRDDLRGGRLCPITVSNGVLFRYQDPEAEDVSVVGEFNDWAPEANPLKRKRGGLWKTVIDLDSGSWPYLFVIDGIWLRDPDNPVLDPDGPDGMGEVSVLHIRRGEVALPRPHGYREGSVDFGGSYQRVDHITLNATLRYQNRTELHPELGIGGGYSFGRERWLYDVEIDQPLFDERLLDIGAAVYRHTATPDAFRISDIENSLAAFFFSQDWRDYHEAEGVEVRAKLYVGSAVRFDVSWRSEHHRTVEKTTDWGLFGNKRMRLNPPVDDGQLRAVTLGYEADTRNSLDNPSRGFYLSGWYEWAGDQLGGDFRFQRGLIDFRRYLKLSRGHFFDVRLAGGRIDQGLRIVDGESVEGFDAIPVQERFYLGGVGTMRATQFKSLVGDRFVLGNAEMRVEVFRDCQVVVFADVGDAWIDEAAEVDLKVDAGVGLQDSDGSLRLNFAKKVDDRGGGVIVSARLRRMF